MTNSCDIQIQAQDNKDNLDSNIVFNKNCQSKEHCPVIPLKIPLPLAEASILIKKKENKSGPSAVLRTRKKRVAGSKTLYKFGGGERGFYKSLPEKITSGCPFLDRFLRGGMHVGGLTEIFGEAGTGKTQFCMQLALTVQLSNRVSGLSAGNLFPSKRFAELCSIYIEKYGDYILPKPMNNVLVEHFQDINSLMECITTRLPKMIETCKARLIIIDSIAPIFRADFENTLESQLQKSKLLRKIATSLRKITREYKTVVIVTNQLTSSISKGKDLPALGLNWSNCVTTRIQLSRQVNGDGDLDRIFQIIFSPRLKPQAITFEITENGFKITEKDCGIFF